MPVFWSLRAQVFSITIKLKVNYLLPQNVLRIMLSENKITIKLNENINSVSLQSIGRRGREGEREREREREREVKSESLFGFS